MRALLVALAALASTGCLGMPSPLAPSLEGSVGVPNGGVLTSSAELPRQGDGFRRFRPVSDSHWGQPHLVAAIQRAAAEVARQKPGGAPLIVGDLSLPGGGKIPRHASHRTGRDVDLLLFVTTPSGAPMQSPGFIPIAADGLAQLEDGRYIRLDVEREWLFIKALLQDAEIDVQFMFISRDLEALIIDYALARETDLTLVWHAQTVMLQPGDSLPHADHIHMRIACRPEEAVRGCLGGGPRWEWLSPMPTLSEPLDDLWAQIRAEDPFDLAPLDAPVEDILPAVAAAPVPSELSAPVSAVEAAPSNVSRTAPVLSDDEGT